MQASLLKLLWETKNNEANWTQQTNKHKRCKKKSLKQNKTNKTKTNNNKKPKVYHNYVSMSCYFCSRCLYCWRLSFRWHRITALWPMLVKKNSQQVLYSNKTVYLSPNVRYLAEISVLGDAAWHDSMQKWGSHSFYFLQLFLTALSRTVSSIYQLSFIFIFHVSR